MKLITLFFLFILLSSCSSNGKIVTRKDKGCPFNNGEEFYYFDLVFLQNTSFSKKITITVKEVLMFKSDKTEKTSTTKYTLNPGEEVKLGCAEQNDITLTYEIVGQLEEK